jgi:hypothetical protein
VWDAKWELLNVTDETELELYIKDKDKMKEDTLLGKAVLVLGAKLEGSQEHILDIVRPDGRVHGQVIVHVSLPSITPYFMQHDVMRKKSRD